MQRKRTSGNRRRLASRPLRLEQLEQRQTLSAASFVPLAGDWDGNGTTSGGVYQRSSGTFFLRNPATTGFADQAVAFGPAAVDAIIPLAGDWNGDLKSSPGYYDPVAGKFYLKNGFTGTAADAVFSFGPVSSTLLPIVGDWNADGKESVGLYDPATGAVQLRNALTSGPADVTFTFTAAAATYQPLGGDWNGDATSTVGLYRAADANFLLRNTNSTGGADLTFAFGSIASGLLALRGDWNGDGMETVGLWDPLSQAFSVRDSNSAGAADNTFYVIPALDPAVVQGITPPVGTVVAPGPTLTAGEVQSLLQRAAAASSSDDAIIAIVDRGGRILGVRVESGVAASITADPGTLAFAVDGAVAKARTAAFFSNNQAPLTSRTIRFISQSTITQREVEANPNSSVATVQGPGFVAPVGLGGHFPPDLTNTPPVDLFGIEHTNRDSIVNAGVNQNREAATVNGAGVVTAVSGDDGLLPARFNADPTFIPYSLSDWLNPPESYGLVSGTFTTAQSRGIATLPGGIPLFKDTNSDGLGDTLVGGIGVFFPGPNGYASYEQGFVAGIGQTTLSRTNAPRVLEAEWIAFAAAGGSKAGKAPVGTLNGVVRVPNFDLPFGRIDLAGVKLEIYGPNPQGIGVVTSKGAAVGVGNPSSGSDLAVLPSGLKYLAGKNVPQGWLVLPHASPTGDLDPARTTAIIQSGLSTATQTRAAIRLPLGSRTRMAFAITDTRGNLLALYRMPDATVFSLDVAVAKARNVAYYANPALIQAVDLVDASTPQDGIPDLPSGIAFTSRTFRYLAGPRYPAGINGPPAPFSSLWDPGVNQLTAENVGAPVSIAAIKSVFGYDAFHPGTNFRDPFDPLNQNGVVFFPGSMPLYVGGALKGGLGVSGDGVDQDDVVSYYAATKHLPPLAARADQYFVRKVRLPFIKFNRNPFA